MEESYRGFVNAWECDENDHLNVQGYVWRFELAARHFCAAQGAKWPAGRLRSRHIRYFSECRTGDLIVGRTASDGAGRLFHHLVDPDRDALLATSLETFDGDDALPEGLPGSEPGETVMPRSIALGPDDEIRPLDTLLSNGYRPSFSGIVAPETIGPERHMADRTFIASGSDGVAHAWADAGFSRRWFTDNNLGRVAVEMNLTLTERPGSGVLYRLVTGLSAVARSTLTFRHVFCAADSGRAFATLKVTALTMDLAARKAVPLPDDMRVAAEQRNAT